MTRRSMQLIACIGVVILAGIACNLNLSPAPTPAPVDEGAIYTQAAATFSAQMTSVAATAQLQPATELPTSTQPPLTSTETLPSLPTDTPQPSFTPLPSFTPPPTPTSTSLAVATLATPLPGGGGTGGPQLPCNAAQFLKDVTVPDGSEFPQGAFFTKIWRIKNVGSCTWTRDYRIVFVKGDKMGAPSAGVELPYSVKPGQYVDAEVDLVAPGEPGEYRGDYMLADAAGRRFGIGKNYTGTFYVRIEVVEAESGSIFNFARSLCAASWKSSKGELPCPGERNDPRGFVLYLSNPELENRHEDEPTIWTNPDSSDDGYIMGTYPRIDLKPGDRFLADIGCLAGFPKCEVVFELKYLNEAGKLKDIGAWDEAYDGKITRIDLDLSTLADKKVNLVLIVRADGRSKDDAAFWLNPQILRP